MATENQKAEPGWEAQYDVIRDLLSSPLALLRFPPRLEQDLRAYLSARAIATLRESYWLIFLLYLAALVMAVANGVNGRHMMLEDMPTSLVMFGLTGLSIASIAICSRIPALDRWYLAYVGVPTVLVLVALLVGPFYYRDAFIRQQTSYYGIYVLLILYGVANMRMLQAMLIGFSGLLLALLAIVATGHPREDLVMLLSYGLLTNLVGVGNAYVLEMRDRRLFLQSRLLELEKRQLNRLTERMVQLAREDGLTGLANRRHFNDNFLMEWERGRRERHPLSLVFVDVDHFKAFNDTYGHLEGDRALVAVASEIRPLARRPGDLAARYGGEEFVLLLPNTPLAGACEIADELLAAVDARRIPHKASSVCGHVTVSIGVAALVPDVHLAPAQLIDLADAALYAAKEGGRHQVVTNDLD